MALSQLTKVIIAAIVGLVIAVIGGILFPVSTEIIHSQVAENIPLRNGSVGFKNWIDPPVPVYMKFRVFDLQNKDATLNGARPKVVEKGPYVYREVRPKLDLAFHDNSTLSYRQTKAYVFVPELSAGTENDTFTTVNLALATLAFQYQNLFSKLNFAERLIVDGILAVAGEKIFQKFTVYQILWGYPDPILSKIGPILKRFGINVPDLVGIFAGQNGTDDGFYNIFTGVNDLNKFNVIDTYRGNRSLPYWNSAYSNEIKGTDGTMWHPFIDQSETLYVFSSDICRSIYATFDSKKQLKGINLLRFVPPPDVFANVSFNPSNIGFCVPNANYCLGAGVLNITRCKQGAPVIVSQPHFYQAAPEYINAIDGVHPNKLNHSTFIDVEPYTGAAMNAAKRLQINIHYKNYSGLDAMKKLPATIYPVLWLEESASLNDPSANQFKQQLMVPLMIFQWIKFGLIFLGLVIMMAAFMYGCVKGVFNRGSEDEEKVSLLKGEKNIQNGTIKDHNSSPVEV